MDITKCVLDQDGWCHTGDEDDELFDAHAPFCEEWGDDGDGDVEGGRWHPADDGRFLTSSRVGFSVSM